MHRPVHHRRRPPAGSVSFCLNGDASPDKSMELNTWLITPPLTSNSQDKNNAMIPEDDTYVIPPRATEATVDQPRSIPAITLGEKLKTTSIAAVEA